MTTLYSSERRRIAFAVLEEIRPDLNAIKSGQSNELRKLFAELTSHIDRRLDDIELAVLEPNSEVADKLRQKHGIKLPKKLEGRSL